MLPQVLQNGRFSVELGDETINEYKLELHCAEEHTDELVKIIVASAPTGRTNSGWVYVMDVVAAIAVA